MGSIHLNIQRDWSAHLSTHTGKALQATHLNTAQCSHPLTPAQSQAMKAPHY